MHKPFRMLLIIGVVFTLVLSCAQTGSKSPTATSAPTKKIIEATSGVTDYSESLPTATLTPTLDPVVLATQAAGFQLITYNADQMAEHITQMEQDVASVLDNLTEMGYDEGPLYRSIWYAIWAALEKFPADPRAGQWRWKLAYYMALAGDGDDATNIYANIISSALNQNVINPQDLPEWFQSGEFDRSIYTPEFILELNSLKVPNKTAGYLVSIGQPYFTSTPGGTCLLVVKDGNTFVTHILYNGFVDRGYSAGYRNPYICKVLDVTDDGIDEIIIEQYSGGHVGIEHFAVFDLRSMPPKIMPFTSSKNTEFSIWGGGIYDYPVIDANTQIQISEALGQCWEYGLTNFQWNGEWFEVTSKTVDFTEAQSGGEVLFTCKGHIDSYAEDPVSRDAIKIFDDAYQTYLPGLISNFQMLEEFRVRKGLYAAYLGDQTLARSVFTEIAEAPVIPDSEWIDPARDFLSKYKTQSDLYRACKAVNICVNYYSEYTDSGCVDIQPCDDKFVLPAIVATNYISSPLKNIIDNLESAGVPVSSSGWYDFDQDGSDELWFTVIHSGETTHQLWIGDKYSLGVKVLFASDLSSLKVDFQPVKTEIKSVLTDIGAGQTLELVHRPGTGEPFVTVRVEKDPAEQNLATFIELRRKLFEGNDATIIYESLLEFDKNHPKTPFEVTEYDYTQSLYDYASYYYTLAYAAELAGKINEAAYLYYYVWATYPDNPFMELARWKLIVK
jgi:hypothetical protein